MPSGVRRRVVELVNSGREVADVADDLGISDQPSGQTGIVGGTATFSAAATGRPTPACSDR